MIVNDINLLHTKTKIKALKLFDLAKKAGIQLELNETLRTTETQMIYYLQGRIDADDFEELNYIRKKYGFWALTKNEAFTKITKTLKSRHLEGRAFDIVISENGKRTYNIEKLKKVGALAPLAGLEWGGSYGDYPHFEDNER